jgi:hypothetical protein
MAKTYTVTTIENGKATTQTLEMSPEMERISDEIAAWNLANPKFWCQCGSPETGDIQSRGHSVDVFCRNCGGCLQVG